MAGFEPAASGYEGSRRSTIELHPVFALVVAQRVKRWFLSTHEDLPRRSLTTVTVIQMSIPFLLVPLDSAPYFRVSILGVLAFATAHTGLSSTFLHYVGKPGIEPGTSGYEGCRRSHHFELQPVKVSKNPLTNLFLNFFRVLNSKKHELTKN